MAQLHNLTFYVTRDELDAVREFYAVRLGLAVVFEEAGHICCFGVGEDMALCIHEAEPAHPAGTRELFFWTDEPDATTEIGLIDPLGHQVRLHRRRG